ncbi:Uncharacterised protein [uncultured archaeon]|nr:Uncharacterised protein [uncultured archaeon]
MGVKSAVMVAKGELNVEKNRKAIGRFGAAHFFFHFHKASTQDVVERLKKRVKELNEAYQLHLRDPALSSNESMPLLKSMDAEMADCCAYVASRSEKKTAAKYNEKAGGYYGSAGNYNAAIKHYDEAIKFFAVNDPAHAQELQKTAEHYRKRLHEEKSFSSSKQHKK